MVDCLENHEFRLASAVRDAMERNGYSLATLESCTGGLIASLLTDVEGAGYLVGAGVAYSPAAKAAFGVSPRVIERYGLVSREVALALAERAARWFETDVGLGITGVAGPGPEDGVPPGTAFAAVWSVARGGVVQLLEVRGSRPSVKREMACLALGLLLQELEASRASGARAGARCLDWTVATDRIAATGCCPDKPKPKRLTGPSGPRESHGGFALSGVSLQLAVLSRGSPGLPELRR